MDAAEVEHAYRTGEMRSGALDTAFIHDRAMRESGHDTSTRLEGICADLATVDLNSLLYKVEMDLAELIRREYAGRFPEGGGKVMGAREWKERAARRNVLLDAYCWDSTAGTYYDYDLVRREHHRFVSATSFYPLWAGAASQDQAERVIATTLPLIEMPGGIAATDERSRGTVSADHPQKQWDYPNGWAPHQMIVWEGLRRTGHPGIAARLAYRWLYTMVSNAVQYNGVVTEKYDVVRRSHEVFAEYGNVGATFSLVPPEGFGWTNASFVVGRALLAGEEQVAALNRLLPPEWVFSSSPASAGSARAPAP
jgi:alpha,alpha-trehalase